MTKIAEPRAAMISTSCALLKFSLRTSNVFEGATREKKKSRPYANIKEVDSRKAGAVTIFSIFAT